MPQHTEHTGKHPGRRSEGYRSKNKIGERFFTVDSAGNTKALES